MRWKLLLLVSTLLPLRSAHAEYRAFDLIITNKTTKAVRHVLSNFDPIQYAGYGTLNDNEQIWYQDTWMCKGRTGDFAPICANPKAAGGPEGAAPASSVPVAPPAPQSP